MPKSHSLDRHPIEENGNPEHVPFLSGTSHGREPNPAHHAPIRQQSSLSQPGTPRTPRTNRVRFDIQETNHAPVAQTHTPNNEEEEEDAWLEGEDYFGGRRSSTAQRAPLLTGIEAPSVTTALEINTNDLLENARPKSGLNSAFMNMANSIIGAGIIGMDLLGSKRYWAYQHGTGQPYAFRQAGMATGVVLLVALTVVVGYVDQNFGVIQSLYNE